MKPKIEDQLQALLDTIERLRAEKFRHLDANLVRELLQLHADSATDGERLRAAEQAVERWLSKEEGSHVAT